MSRSCDDFRATQCTETGKSAAMESGDQSGEAQDLLARALRGDSKALMHLLESYRSYLLVLARLQIERRLQGKVDAADLVQETLLMAHRDVGQFGGSNERQFTAWLRSLLAHVGANVRRRFDTQQRDVRLERDMHDDLNQSSQMMGSLIAPDTSPSERASRREQAVLLAEALTQLPADYAEVIILHHLERQSMAEVAQRMGRSVGSVRKLWARALVRLRKCMGGAHEP